MSDIAAESHNVSATVIVSTRNRPESLAGALRSLTQAVPLDGEIIVVDQSDDDLSSRVVQSVTATDRRVSYMRSERRGASAARNDGAAIANSDLLLFIDDDCLIEAGWVETWRDLFAVHPEAGVGFGPVHPSRPDRPGSITPAFDPGATVKTYSLDIFRRGMYDIGMAANMALRRRDWLAVGGFDEGLGAGARFPGAEDQDVAYRIVKHGRGLVHAPAPAVIHLGSREGDAAWRLYSGYARGTGATLVKLIRCHDANAWEIFGRDLLRLWMAIIRKALTGRRPLGLQYLRWYVLGALQALSVAVNAEKMVFQPERAHGSSMRSGGEREGA